MNRGPRSSYGSCPRTTRPKAEEMSGAAKLRRLGVIARGATLPGLGKVVSGVFDLLDRWIVPKGIR